MDAGGELLAEQLQSVKWAKDNLPENIERIANVPRHSFFKGHNVNVNIVVLNCQKCQVSGLKSLGLLFEGVL